MHHIGFGIAIHYSSGCSRENKIYVKMGEGGGGNRAIVFSL